MTGRHITDRITGRSVPSVPSPPERAALGRYVDLPRRLNPSGGGALAGERRFYTGERDCPPALPDAVTVEAILEVGRRISALARRGASLADLMEVSPLVDRAAARRTLEWQQLDADIDKHLPYLRAVCFRPASRLGRVDRLLPVPRVRRITQNTVTRMAAHSEDWHALRPDGVRPARALSPERETDLDLYENRVAAHLADQLWRYLTLRVAQIRRISTMFSDIQHYIVDISARPFRRSSGRLWDLVVGLTRHADWQAQAALRLDELERLRAALWRLRSSPVWNGTNRRIALGTVLRTTNLFTDEERYRNVAQLWHRWIAAQTQRLSEDDRHRYLQDWCKAFISYSQLLVIRAIDELGAVADAPAAIGEPVMYRYAATSFTLKFTPDGALVLEQPAGPLLRITPIPHSLTSSCDDRAVQAELAAFTCDPPTIPTLVMYPGTREERQELAFQLRLRTFEPPGMVSRQGADAPVWLLPVSPLEIDSVTRLARTLRLTLEQSRLSGYPFKVRCGPTAARAFASEVKWLASSKSASASVGCRPSTRSLWCEARSWQDSIRIELPGMALRGLRPKHSGRMSKRQYDAPRNWLAVPDAMPWPLTPAGCASSARTAVSDARVFVVRAGKAGSAVRACASIQFLIYLRGRPPSLSTETKSIGSSAWRCSQRHAPSASGYSSAHSAPPAETRRAIQNAPDASRTSLTVARSGE